jgi:CysZ protein
MEKTFMQGNSIKASQYLIRGFKMLNEPGVRPFVIIPLLINVVLFLTMGAFAVDQFNAWMEALLGSIPEWLSWITWLLWPIFIIMLLLLFSYAFTIVANFIASPFNGFLAEKVEEKVTGQAPDSDNSWRALVALIPHSLGREIAKLLYYLPWALGVWIITMIPAINTLAPVLWFVFGSWMMAIQYVDYPMDNHKISFAELKNKLREQRLSSLGFGLTVMIGTLIPIVNFFIIPAAICGATLFWVEELKER